MGPIVKRETLACDANRYHRVQSVDRPVHAAVGVCGALARIISD
jgi:hypothetical protein